MSFHDLRQVKFLDQISFPWGRNIPIYTPVLLAVNKVLPQVSLASILRHDSALLEELQDVAHQQVPPRQKLGLSLQLVVHCHKQVQRVVQFEHKRAKLLVVDPGKRVITAHHVLFDDHLAGVDDAAGLLAQAQIDILLV